MQIEREVGSENVFAEEVVSVGLINRLSQGFCGVNELTTDVDVTDIALNSISSDGHSFDKLEWRSLHQHLVFEGSGLTLVRIADNIMRLHFLFWKAVPLDPARESCAASSSQPRCFDLVNDALSLHLQSFF